MVGLTLEPVHFGAWFGKNSIGGRTRIGVGVEWGFRLQLQCNAGNREKLETISEEYYTANAGRGSSVEG